MKRWKSNWSRIPKWGKIISFVLLGIVGVTLMGVIVGLVIMILWNWLMPGIFNLKEITYWQAIGIFVLAKLILGFGNDGEAKTKKTERKDHDDEDSYNSKDRSQESKSWMYYDEWWESEGKKGFDDFIEKRKENNPINN